MSGGYSNGFSHACLNHVKVDLSLDVYGLPPPAGDLGKCELIQSLGECCPTAAEPVQWPSGVCPNQGTPLWDLSSSTC